MMKTISTLIFSIFLLACSSPSSNKSTAVQSSDTVVTAVPIATSDTMSDGVSGATSSASPTMLNGTLMVPAENNITITLPMGGVVASFTHLPGEFVRKGEVIAVLENTEFIELQQSYLEATAQTIFLEAEYNRQKALSAEDATSQKRLQQSHSDYLTIKSRKEAAAARLSMLGVNTKELSSKGIAAKLEVRTPQSGYISDVMVNQGKYVATGETICQIINKSQLFISLVAYEKDLKNLQNGQSLKFRVNGLGDKIFTAIISTIDQQVDPVNRSVKVYAKVTTVHPDFRPGMYVIAQFK